MLRLELGVFAAMLTGCASCSALAQDALSSPLERAVESKASDPITTSPAASADPDIDRLIKQISGSFRSEAKGDAPALVLNAAHVTAAGMTDIVLLEIARADDPGDPFRVTLLHPYRRQGQMRLRQFEIVGSGMKDVLVGLWAAPESIPPISVSNIQPVIDMPLSLVGEHFGGRTPQPMPILRDGAIEVTAVFSTSERGISLADAGYDASGRMVWGTSLESPIEFVRVSTPPPVWRTPEGLVVVTTVQPAPGAPRHQAGTEVTLHFTGWLTNGHVIETTRKPGAELFTRKLPSDLIRGWNEGLVGIAKGERRRLVVPGPLAYGGHESRGRFPPNATLIFDVECVHVATPTSEAIPESRPQAEPAPQVAPGDQIGTPPTNATPEKPR